jgi:hypothetical protein
MLRRALADYARRRLNLVLLVVVPVVLVFVWGASLAEFSKLLGGATGRGQLAAATAGWAAAVLAGLAGFFQVSGSRAADRRLAAAGGRTAAVVAGRLGASLGLAGLASLGGLVALAARAGISDWPRAVAGTVLAAVIYLALGVVVGTLVRTDMNGALVVTFAWVFDVFFGPALGTGRLVVTWLFPLHFPTLVLIGQASGHAGPVGDVGWALIWAVGLSALAVARLAVTIRPAALPANSAHRRFMAPNVAAAAGPRPGTAVHPTTGPVPAVASNVAATPAVVAGRAPTMARLGAVLRAGMREYRRNRVLWVLLVVVPVVFIAMAVAVTPDKLGPVSLVDGAGRFTAMLSMRRVHGATMAPIAIAFLAGITGLFVVTGSEAGDRRLVLAGLRPREVLAGRLGVIAAASVVATAVAVAVSAMFYPPRQWAVFAAASLLIGLTYAMVGVLIGPITGRLGGLYLILLLAFVDVGLGQTVMFHPVPPAWGAFLPARGASSMLIDGAFTARFDSLGSLLLGLAWLAALTFATIVVFQRRTGSRRPPVTEVRASRSPGAPRSAGAERPAARPRRAQPGLARVNNNAVGPPGPGGPSSEPLAIPTDA